MGFKLYEQLELSRDAGPDEIKKAYRKLAVKYHPDKGGDPEKFKEISNAYQILSDPDKKQRYDQLGDDGFRDMEAGGPGMDPTSIFEQFFRGGHGFMDPFGGMFGGGGPPRPRKCRSIQHAIQITNKEAYFGSEKHIKITLHRKCLKCLETCGACQGRGQITEMQRMGPFTNMMTRPCATCRGSGQVSKGKGSCEECKGKGGMEEEKRLDLKIPKGVETGFAIKFDGYGEQPNVSGDVPGDLIFEILVQPDPVFERRGLDLIYRQSLSFVESVVGKTITIPHYEKTIEFDTGSLGVIQPSKEYALTETGMQSDKHKGKIILVFSVNYPKKPLTDKQKSAIKEAFSP